ncbi:hypothetical protein SNK03_007275 [Fusarium graminearum]|uniref:Chromosome 2, complete genome n=1 Tax=Gibberella zeae (strain ATCC MYA-4620 / CBS 123657 / FGSC 9075 / NRRL 31084 / PH-1) TaxID=229533 RepID=I1S5Y6_GIBZE|nr:hypothetical protein FGSG_12257 [Fusarium graminearum PH-1]ESU08677.1 hypothetical protein FGSG_12257 [Fusarium graminearum PH-1]CAF3648727.1 unnamed protein product [Fusarium graminearum]CEF79433.1 unnamed protein product [Fusarium graminearum]CZS82719.1 unnamed protein product [Fusarium graminearum]|eukprot:XP_011321176.1 hypothetical protein FGSG_12257 [Fusarium graminearum PH-1]
MLIKPHHETPRHPHQELAWAFGDRNNETWFPRGIRFDGWGNGIAWTNYRELHVKIQLLQSIYPSPAQERKKEVVIFRYDDTHGPIFKAHVDQHRHPLQLQQVP